MGKYFKMADVFDGEVKAKHIDEESIAEIVDGEDSGKNWSIEDSRYWLAMSYEHAGYAAHAINSHDELVAEVERLRSENQSLMKCRMAAREFFNCTVASGGSVKVSSASKSALDDAGKASDWLEIELKATADLVEK